MEKLTFKSKLFYDLMYMVWSIAGYYEALMCYTVPEKASDMESDITNENGITKLYFKLPRIQDQNPAIQTNYMVDIFNHHLYYDLLPSAGIPKYKTGTSMHDVTEAFIVNNIIIDDDFVTVVIIYVDNPLAYDFVYMHPYI